MIIEVDIPDGSPELEELQFVVAGINAERKTDAAEAGLRPPIDMTVEEYVVPIVLGHFKKRVTEQYVRHARTRTTEQLKDAFGSLDNVRGT